MEKWEVTKEDIPEISNMFTVLWRFVKKYYKADSTDEYWDTVFEESNRLHKEFNTELCKDMLVSIINEFERQAKKVRDA